MLERGDPPGVCDFAYRGDVCWRVNCSYTHLLTSRTAPSVAVQQQQQQPHALPPPPRPSPPPPLTLWQQSPQYQAAASVGREAAGGGAGTSRPLAVARFSRNYAAGGRVGASTGGGAGRGTGSNCHYGLCHLPRLTEGGAGAREEWAIFAEARRSVRIFLLAPTAW